MAKVKVCNKLVGRLRGLPHVAARHRRAHRRAASSTSSSGPRPITDFKHPDEDGVDVGILTGSVSDTHQEEVAHEMRKRAKILISMGDCSVFGGICTMRNFCGTEECLEYAYTKTPSTDSEGKVPALAGAGQAASTRSRR